MNHPHNTSSCEREFAAYELNKSEHSALHCPVPFRTPRSKHNARQRNAKKQKRWPSGFSISDEREEKKSRGEFDPEGAGKKLPEKKSVRAAVCYRRLTHAGSCPNSTKAWQKIFQPFPGLITPLHTWKTPLLQPLPRIPQARLPCFRGRPSKGCAMSLRHLPARGRTPHEHFAGDVSTVSYRCRLLPMAKPSLRSAHNACGGTASRATPERDLVRFTCEMFVRCSAR